MNIENIIEIQSIFRGYIVRKNNITSSKYQNKTWRKSQKWYKNGKFTECEKYQIKQINKITQCEIKKTDLRLNTETYELLKKTKPLLELNGFEWTEDFDGILKYNENLLYFNLKFVCDNSGSQTRSLREVYHFIKAQIGFLQNNKVNDIIFINILDGDTSYKHLSKYHYLLSKHKSIISNIFVGDMLCFRKWFSHINK
jgi:hypothetical protein